MSSLELWGCSFFFLGIVLGVFAFLDVYHAQNSYYLNLIKSKEHYPASVLFFLLSNLLFSLKIIKKGNVGNLEGLALFFLFCGVVTDLVAMWYYFQFTKYGYSPDLIKAKEEWFCGSFFLIVSGAIFSILDLYKF